MNNARNNKFSIIVVSLNTKKDFLKTYKSIINQKFKSFEIIVIDGKSNDGTIDSIKKYSRNFSKIVIEKDKGIYDAMNKGTKYISGNWSIFLNSGDTFYNSQTLFMLNKLISKNKYLDVIVGKNVIDAKIKYLTNFEKISLDSQSSGFSHQSTIYKSDIFKFKKFNLKFKIAADYELVKYLIKKNKKFFYTKLIISSSKPGGISDKMRYTAEKEFYLINSKYKKSNIFLFNYYKNILIIFLKNIIKFFLPKNLILVISRVKSKRR